MNEELNSLEVNERCAMLSRLIILDSRSSVTRINSLLEHFELCIVDTSARNVNNVVDASFLKVVSSTLYNLMLSTILRVSSNESETF